ncbi:MAG: fumarylacetoacetate hydrolase family protein [Salinirussus sp.]
MQLARAVTRDGVQTGELVDGKLETDETVYDLDGPARLLAPCEPGTFYCVGRNYATTLDAMEYDRPEQPDWFIKPAVSLLDPGAQIEYPEWTDELTYAGELAAVIDEECTGLSDESEIRDAIRGWTILNDLDALDQPGRTARKAFDGAAPLGPVIETDLDPCDLDMETHIGDERRQSANTAQMLFDPFEVLAFLSERYTFRPGDVISFGSPENPGLLEPGDEITIWYEGIGTLRNRVVA